MAKATAAVPATLETGLPAKFKPKHPIVLVLSSLEARQLSLKQAIGTLQVLLALNLSKTPFDLVTVNDCKWTLNDTAGSNSAI